MLQATARFSERVDNYTLYRPGYPNEIILFLQEATGLKKRFRIADIGSGTGIFTELLLKNGFRVKAIEPNANMRNEAEKNLSRYSGFLSIDGTAEQTGLESGQIDLIVAAQAFHWFNPLNTKKEFTRILKPGGHIALVWNISQANTPFLAGYRELKIKYGNDYKGSQHANIATIETFFHPMKVITKKISHEQLLDYEAVKGLLLSNSHMPLENHENYPFMIKELKELFLENQQKGIIQMNYETNIYTNENQVE